MRSPYSCFLRYNLLKMIFVICNVSNIEHKPIVVSSSIMLYMTSSARHNWIILVTFRPISSQSSSDILAGFIDFPCKVLLRPCYTSNAFILFCHKPNFTIELLDLELYRTNFYLRHIAFSLTFSSDTNCWVQLAPWYQLLCTTYTLAIWQCLQEENYCKSK